MEAINNFETINDFNKFNNHETLHPLVNVLDLSKANKRKGCKMFFGLYVVFLKDVNCGDLRYGRHNYDYQKGTLVFVAPGQLTEATNKEYYQPSGVALAFHPDLIKGTPLAKKIGDYSFFSYEMSEALHMSEQERQIILDCFSKIKYEIEHAVDSHSKTLISSNIELFLNYCSRFYDRQFITREDVHKGVLERFENLLNGYFKSDNPRNIGLPSVTYCANELNLSTNYFGDLVKKETGRSPQEYIHSKLIDEAKERVLDQNKSLSEIAYELGFKYPQHFTRLFKNRVGYLPSEYRVLN
ncbi:helix-turn-helix domain-containing protein [Albibacterium bauzanense]|uniref:Helix-turn-helix protein n=1 Tax=Albibacterium bauzanense TaxID=653929 RepID=A0A4R1M2L2_9SPHI|nr:AraC family transcriptional regulator [Albibacterium bauzanense]TCK85452.1 helix-turn-helix protein [Albibacterium bauzanense]